MTVGDLVKYNPDECNNEIPGLVVGFGDDPSHDLIYLLVQWFDWTAGDLACENPGTLVLVSKA